MTKEVAVAARPLRVLYIMHNAAPGGAARSLLYLIESLPPGTVESYALCPNGPMVGHFEKAGVVVLHIPGVSMLLSIAGVPLRGRRLMELIRTIWLMRYGGIIRRVIRSVQPDIVHLNERGMFHAAAIARRAGVPVVMHARSVADNGTGWVRTLANRLINRYVNRVIAINESVRSSLHGVERCQVIYNPISGNKAELAARGAEPQVRSDQPKKVRVSFLAGLLPSKGVWDLLESAKILRRRDDIVFQIAGGNSRPKEFHQTMRGRLVRLFGFAPDVERAARVWIAREHLEHRAVLVGHLEQISDFLAETDILVFPSHLNGPGRSVIEAGVRGIPAIVALADKVEDIIEDGVTGLIVRERDPQALAQAIARLADDGDLRAHLGANARRKYLLQFDSDLIASQVLNVYHSVIAESRGRDPKATGH